MSSLPIIGQGRLGAKRSDEKVLNMYDNFKHGLQARCFVAKTANCLGWRPSKEAAYEWLSYEQTHERMMHVSSALASLNITQNGNGHKCIGIYAVNCVQWTLASYAAYTQSHTVVPLYDTLGAEAVVHVVVQTEMQVIVVDNYKKLLSLLKVINELPSIKHFIVIKDEPGDEKDAVLEQMKEHSHVQLVTFDQWEADGRTRTTELHLPGPDDLAIVCYTSGTTGLPKGVMLTHRQMISVPHAVMTVLYDMGLGDLVGPGKCMISFLPLAHIFEHAMEIYLLFSGGCIGFYSGSVTTLMDDIQALKPNVFPLVPRLLSRLYDNIQAKVAEGGKLKGMVFNWAYSSKLAKLKQGIITKSTFWDKIVFKEAQAKLGGNIELMITGAAPIASEVLELCRVVLGCVIVEGYGQTECAAACSLTLPGDPSGGHVGPPMPCNEIKLADVPDMKYFAADQKGEVCIRGPNVMKGYYQDEEKTKEAVDEDGWLHTGDVGMWLPNGCLKLIDRKKHIFKTAQGEYVAPEKIEQVYMRMPLIEQIFVDGHSTQRYIVAVVVPDQPTVRAWLKSGAGAGAVSPEAAWDTICADASVRQHIQTNMTAFAKTNKLNSIETVKAIYLCAVPFSLEDDLLTPTLKTKRPNLRKHFEQQIDKLYADNPNL